MAGNGNSSIGHWIAIAGVLVAVPSALVAWQSLGNDGSIPDLPGIAAGSDHDGFSNADDAGTTESSDNGEAAADLGESRIPEDNGSGTPSGESLDVSNCVITVDHIGAQIHSEPDHAARTLSSVPDGDYRPSAATESDWAGRTELWYQLTVDGRTGWLPYSSITVRSVSSGCP